MGSLDWARFWNTTAAEEATEYPARRYAIAPYQAPIRAIDVTAHSWAGRLRTDLLTVGDLVMMRKQLLNRKALAERSTAPA